MQILHTRAARVSKAISRVAAADTPVQSADDADAPRQNAWTTRVPPSLRTFATPHNFLLLNGRLAMMGMATGVGGELLHHKSLGAQLVSTEPRALLLALLLFAASVIPLLRGEQEGDEVFGPFNPEAEMLNGNLAIVGLVALVLIEAVKGSALF